MEQWRIDMIADMLCDRAGIEIQQFFREQDRKISPEEFKIELEKIIDKFRINMLVEKESD